MKRERTRCPPLLHYIQTFCYCCSHKVVEHVKRERALLDRLSYEGIVRLHFTFQDALSLYMGLEVCPNGEGASSRRHLAGVGRGQPLSGGNAAR